MGRRRRSDGPREGLWFVTATVTGFRPVFANPKAAQAALRELGRYAKKHKVEIYEYVIMPHHIHLIVQTTDQGGTLSDFMRDLKRSIAYECRANWDGETGLWMDRFDDLLLTSEKTFLSKRQYIVNNPIKADLCAEAEQYQYSSAWARLHPDEAVCPVADYSPG